MLRPLSEVTIEGGGVWRTKWSIEEETGNENNGYYIVAAAMHAGCSIIKLDSLFQMSKMYTYRDDASQNTLCYGASVLSKKHPHCNKYYNDCSDDERWGVAEETNFIIGSCSFYEDVIHIWSCAL